MIKHIAIEIVNEAIRQEVVAKSIIIPSVQIQNSITDALFMKQLSNTVPCKSNNIKHKCTKKKSFYNFYITICQALYHRPLSIIILHPNQ